MADHDQNQTLGSGRLHFNRFADGTKTGTGERYMGNSPDFANSQAEETLDHYNADDGVRTKDLSVQTSQDTSGSFTLDDISRDNLALWYLGITDTVAVSAATGLTQDFVAQEGTYFQLGVSTATPQGHGGLDNVVVKKGATTITMSGNYEIDLETGRGYIIPGAPGITDGDTLTATFDTEVQTVAMVLSKSLSIYGSLRFISNNPVGKRRDGFFPYVKISPNGDYNLKGTDWQTLSFNLDILKLNGATERVYWTDRA